MVGTYLRYFTFLPHEEILALDAATAEHPERREAHRVLARQVCTLVHGDDETTRAELAAAALFGGDLSALDERTLLDVFADAPSTDLPSGRLEGAGVLLVDLLAETGLVKSKSQARTTVSQGGAYVNNGREDDVDRRVTRRDLVAGRYLVLRRGKKDHHLVRFA